MSLGGVILPQVGPLEVVVLLIIVLIIFGPKRLPEMGRSLGRGIREFRHSINKDDSSAESTSVAKPTVIERSDNS